LFLVQAMNSCETNLSLRDRPMVAQKLQYCNAPKISKHS